MVFNSVKIKLSSIFIPKTIRKLNAKMNNITASRSAIFITAIKIIEIFSLISTKISLLSL